jgi:hypothetical protein
LHAAGLVDAAGKPTITAHRFRHTIGTQLAEGGARIQTIMAVLGHRTPNMSIIYASLSDPTVKRQYQDALDRHLGPDVALAGPAADALREHRLDPDAVSWLQTNFLKTELELGYCLRTPAEGPCECDLVLTCSKFLTTSDYIPRLRARLAVEDQLIDDAAARGWNREVERHRATRSRIEQLLAQLGSPPPRSDDLSAPAVAGAGVEAGPVTDDEDVLANISQRYQRFADKEARGRSPLYEQCARAIATDPAMLAFLAALPEPKRQPNLLFAAARWLAGTPDSYAPLRDVVLERHAALTELMLARRTQTNEPARCATLLPVLAALPQPLALLEVGASAGLTLLPDRYSYDYAGHTLTAADPAAPVLRCQPHGPVPVPEELPEVVWRAGIDLNPLDVTDADDAAWLRCLIWPGEPDRQERLDAALAIARRDPPHIVRGDLVDDLPALAAEAPPHATLVVFHSAVLVYVSASRRRDFATAVGDLDAIWLSNEARGVLADLTNEPTPRPGTDPFTLARDGRTALALTDGHGTWIEWISERPLATTSLST